MGKLDWSRKDMQEPELDREHSVPSLEISMHIDRCQPSPGKVPGRRLLGSALFTSNHALLTLDDRVELVRGHELAGRKHGARSGRRSRKKKVKGRKSRSNLAKKALIFLVAVLIGIHAGDWRPFKTASALRAPFVGPAPSSTLSQRL